MKTTKSKTTRLAATVVLSGSLPVLTQTVLAGEQEELPHAFDAGWKGQKTCEVLFEDESMRVGRCVFPPGVGHEKHYHNPHFGYVLEGSVMRISDNDGVREITIRNDAHWSSPMVTVHEALNTGETTGSYLIIETLGE